VESSAATGSRRPSRRGLRFGFLIALALLGLAVAVPIVVLAGGETNPGSSGVSRIERTFAGRVWNCPSSSLSEHECPRYFMSLTTPADVPTVDVVVTATITYRLGEGESVRAIFGYATGPLPPLPCCSGLEPTTPFRPGDYPLATTRGRANTTTLSWIARGLPAAGATYRLYFQLVPPGSGARRIVTRKAAFVVETWSVGN
jgi:hypothetical protein